MLNKNKLVIIIFIIIFLVYLLFAGRFKFYYPKTNRDYFTRLAYSFLQMKLDVPDPGFSPNDLSIYKGKYYLYWGPLPSILLVPVVYFLGTNISDVLYTAIGGILNVIFFYLMLVEFIKWQNLKVNSVRLILLLICFAFGSIHFYLSVLGTVWFASQIFSLGFFLISLFFLFNFANNKRYRSLLLSIILLSFSLLGKYTFFLSIPLYLSIIARNIKLLPYWKLLSIFLVVISAISFIWLYNQMRFDSIIDNGLKYMEVNPVFYTDINTFGYFHPLYILKNIYYLFLNPKIPDPYGTSLFVTSPIFLLLIFSFYKGHIKRTKEVNSLFQVIGLSIVLMLMPVLIYYGGGWFQWGYRYALDIYPLLFLLLLLIIDKYETAVIGLLVAVSVALNLFGTLWMMRFARFAY